MIQKSQSVIDVYPTGSAIDEGSLWVMAIPSKTFLIGEYAVLEGAKALLVNTKPCFLFSVIAQKQDQLASWVHPQSPAGQWLNRYPEIQQTYHVTAYDPHKGKGGFGYSTAQFSLVYVLGQMLGLYKSKTLLANQPVHQNKTIDSKTHPDLLSLWEAYRNFAIEGCVPSGADLVSQWAGRMCVFCPEPFQARSFSWPFSDLDFFLIRTGVTLNTHQHLKNYKRAGKGPCLSPKLTDIVQSAVSFVETKDKQGFISALDQYSAVLEEYGLIHPKALKLIKQIKLVKGVKTARGCGAMGAEVVALFFDSHNKKKVQAFLNNKNNIVSSQDIYPEAEPALLAKFVSLVKNLTVGKGYFIDKKFNR